MDAAPRVEIVLHFLFGPPKIQHLIENYMDSLLVNFFFYFLWEDTLA